MKVVKSTDNWLLLTPFFNDTYSVLIVSTHVWFVDAHWFTETTLPPIALQQSDDGSTIQRLFCHIVYSSWGVDELLKLRLTTLGKEVALGSLQIP